MTKPECIIPARHAAQRLGLSIRTLARMRAEGNGPRYVRLGSKRLGYSLTELDRWAATRTHSSRAAELARERCADA